MDPDRSNRTLDLLGVELPVIQAPMVGATTAEMVIAVTSGHILEMFSRHDRVA